jgi:hypothetical protein
MWSDTETTLDLVGFRVHSDLIRAVVTDASLLPVTIGLFGDWGGGKSSILKMLAHDLDPKHCAEEQRAAYEKIACLHFNGWLFEGYDDAKSALLSTLLKELVRHERFGPKVRNKAKKLLQSVDWMRAAKLGLTKIAIPAAMAYVTGGASLGPAVAEAAGKLFKPKRSEAEDEGDEKTGGKEEKDDGEDSPFKGLLREEAAAADPQDVRTFREEFQGLLNDAKIETLVVLIDDLDRCSPEHIVENLEAIKLFLNVEGTAFVIGADPRIVRHAVATHYRSGAYQFSVNEVEEAEQLVRDYLEKVIQIPYHLPRLSPSETETYMSLLFCQREIEDKDSLDGVLTACEAQRAKDRYQSFGKAAITAALGDAGLPASLETGLSFTVGAAPLINEGLKGNPRQIKRFLNAFVLRKKLAHVARLEHVRDDVVVKLMILEYAHPEEFLELYDWQARQDGHPKEVRRYEELAESGEAMDEIPAGWRTPSMVKWLTMEPSLVDEDLRDYFWLARDKMASTLSGMSLVSPAVQTLAKSLMSEVSGMRETAAKEAAALTEAERSALLRLLEQAVVRNPDQEAGYDAFHALIDQQVLGSSEALARALQSADARKLLAGEAFRLQELFRSRPELKQVFDPVLTPLRKANVPFGAALGEEQ